VSAVSTSTRVHRYLHYDVFTDTALTGNQLAVFTNPSGLTTDDMARVTREMNFSECTFIVPAERPGADVRVRIFGLAGEMPFAGHPVIGSAFALAHDGRGKPSQGSVIFELVAGPTPVDLEWNGAELGFAWMTQPLPSYGPTLERRERVASALGIDLTALIDGAPIQEVSYA
jgi:trans-2,3-dihydro-3-hydroxyanthranilate isomerase